MGYWNDMPDDSYQPAPEDCVVCQKELTEDQVTEGVVTCSSECQGEYEAQLAREMAEEAAHAKALYEESQKQEAEAQAAGFKSFEAYMQHLELQRFERERATRNLPVGELTPEEDAQADQAFDAAREDRFSRKG